jgi:hypothetical protein
MKDVQAHRLQWQLEWVLNGAWALGRKKRASAL